MLQTGLLSQIKPPFAAPDSAEYTIYAYDNFKKEKLGHNRWQRVATITDQSQAMSQAQSLFDSRLYQKVEIKQKLFYEKKGCHVAKTLRVYESGRKSNMTGMVTIFVIAVISAGLFCLNCF